MTEKQRKIVTRKAYGFGRDEILYPYLTFENDTYNNFMTLIMQNLEIRFIKAGQIIAKELEECNEILFVFSGFYNVGYEVNKKTYYTRQFGQSTIIGAYQVCFKKRFAFNYIAETDMVCYAIRK